MFGPDALVARLYDKTQEIRQRGISWVPDLWGIVVRQWVSRKFSAGLAPKTVHYMKGTLRTALHQAVEDGLVVRKSLRQSGRARR